MPCAFADDQDPLTLPDDKRLHDGIVLREHRSFDQSFVITAVAVSPLQHLALLIYQLRRSRNVAATGTAFVDAQRRNQSQGTIVERDGGANVGESRNLAEREGASRRAGSLEVAVVNDAVGLQPPS